MTNTDHPEQPSILTQLRALTPPRSLSLHEALRIAELQATRLLSLSAVTQAPTPGEVITMLPRIHLSYRDLPTSGMSYWNGQDWIICLNRSEPFNRQRFTLFHEFKHIIDHPRTQQQPSGDARDQAELVADYFAACALMPKLLLKQAWYAGQQQIHQLAELFAVSPRAMEIRLHHLRLNEPRSRCQPLAPARTSQAHPSLGHYFRALSIHTPEGARV